MTVDAAVNGPVSESAFMTSFANVGQGRTLDLVWSHIDPKYEPLSITARLINRTSENHGNGFAVTLNSRVSNTSSYAWRSVPYPLPYMASGVYEVEIRPSFWNLSSSDASLLSVPVLARSTFFSILGQDGSGLLNSTDSDSDSTNTTTPDHRPGQLVTGDEHIPTGPNKVALALGLSIGVAGALVLTAVLIVLRRRHLADAAESEKRHRRRTAYVTD